MTQVVVENIYNFIHDLCINYMLTLDVEKSIWGDFYTPVSHCY